LLINRRLLENSSAIKDATVKPVLSTHPREAQKVAA